MNYIIAESIKTRRTILTYFIVLAPVINIMMCILIAGSYNIQSFGIYWWCTFMMPALAALFCSEHERQNRKSGNDKMLYTFPINLFRFRSAGIIAIAIKLFWAYLVMGLALAVFSRYLGVIRISGTAVIVSFAVLYICSLWMIPGCLLFGRRCNIYILMSVHVICNILLPPFIADTSLWVLCPYCYGPKAIEALAGIKISGDYIEVAGMNPVVIVAVLSALFIFLGLSVLESKLYANGYPEKRMKRK